MDKIKIFKEIKSWYRSEDLDIHIHELKANEASEINNNGIDTQLEFLANSCGLDWLVKTFLKE